MTCIRHTPTGMTLNGKPILQEKLSNSEKRSFMAGFTAGYAKGQNDAGEGGYWCAPPDRDEAWINYKTPPKKIRYSKKQNQYND